MEALAEGELGREVSPHFSHLPATADDAGGLWFEIAIDGVVLWERDAEVSRCLRVDDHAKGRFSEQRAEGCRVRWLP